MAWAYGIALLRPRVAEADSRLLDQVRLYASIHLWRDARVVQPAAGMEGEMSSKYVCLFCGHIYDEATGSVESGIAPETLWKDVPEDWMCPLCGNPKSSVVLMES